VSAGGRPRRAATSSQHWAAVDVKECENSPNRDPALNCYYRADFGAKLPSSTTPHGTASTTTSPNRTASLG
jgi:hypothetical protein